MNLIRTSFLNGIAVVIKMAALLGINKVLAVYIGPAGYAVVGQFQNAMYMISTAAGGAISTGVTKYTAEYHYDEARQYAVWRTAFAIVLVCSIGVGLLVAGLNQQLAAWFLGDEEFGTVFLWFSSVLVFFPLNLLVLAIFSGKKDVARYVWANIIGSILSLAASAIMVAYYGLWGALLALAIYQSISFIATFALCCKAPWLVFNRLAGGLDRQIAINLTKYAAMALTSAACVPVSHILVRNHLGESFGWDFAGYWEAMWRLSAAYLLLVTSTLSLYYLPRMSELTLASEIKQELIRGYKLIVPLAALCGILVYFMRDFIVSILFSESFLPMRELFAWQMLGDFFKVGGYVLAFLVLGKAMTVFFIVTEVCFAAGFVVLTWILTDIDGFHGVAIAHAVNYALYWIVMAVGVYWMAGRA